MTTPTPHNSTSSSGSASPPGASILPDTATQSGSVFLPGATIGILGGGQLGRMLAMVARRMGYGVVVYTPDADSPAGHLADATIVAPYEDEAALRRFAAQTDVITLEFENIPTSALQILADETPVYPGASVLEIAQNRLKEKTFLVEQGIPVAPFAAVHDEADLASETERLGFPLILKTAGFGYDGKGQARVEMLEEAKAAYRALGQATCILERFIDLDREISVIAARSDNGVFAAYRPVENRHQHHILDITLAPAALSSDLETQAVTVTRRIMDALEMRGLLCVEFFISKQGDLLVNEMAPRPHNSGHYTIEAAICSQFEQQLRAVCGLPLGDTSLLHAAAMANLLGDRWADGEPNWAACLAYAPVYLHLYGKRDPKPGRKMGHITALADTPQAACSLVQISRNALEKR